MVDQVQSIKEQNIKLKSQLQNIRTSINKFADSFIMLDLKDEMIIEQLPGGGFADIYSIKPSPSNQNIILKVFKSNDYRELQQELKNLMISKLGGCSNVVQLQGIAFMKQFGQIKVSILLQQAKENLSSRLKKHTTIQEKFNLALDIICGLCQLHELQIAHLDLKPDNILILDDGKAILTDLGISKQLTRTHKTSDVDRSPQYCAPEQYNINNQRLIELRVQCDLWSFGCVLLAIFGEIQPWSWLPEKTQNFDMFQIAILKQIEQKKNPLDHIQDDQKRNQVHAKIPNELLILMRDLFNYNPKQRPTANETKIRLEQIKCR